MALDPLHDRRFAFEEADLDADGRGAAPRGRARGVDPLEERHHPEAPGGGIPLLLKRT